VNWNHEWCTEWRVAFVARTLDEEEQSRYAEHLPHCPECTLAIAELADDIALLSLGVVPLEPGPALDPVAAAASIVASSREPAGGVLDTAALATIEAVTVRDELGLLEILHDRSGQRWAARLRGVPQVAAVARFQLAYVDGTYEVHRCTLRADGEVVTLIVTGESPAVLGATLTVERDGEDGVVVGHVVVGG
jgi:hypothetical protein